MNYEKIYYTFITTRKALKRIKTKEHYFEKHHIKPRSLGGDNSEDNLVLLTPKEHYFAHLLLVQFTSGKDKTKMIYALWMLRGRKLCSSRQYAYARELYIQQKKSEPSKLKGRTYKEIYGDNLEYTLKIRKDKLKGKTYEEIYGVEKAAEMREKCRLRNLGKKASPETKEKMSASFLNSSDELKEKRRIGIVKAHKEGKYKNKKT